MLKCIKFPDIKADAANVREEGYDPILKIRCLVNQMKGSYRGQIQPEKYISVDERMLRFKERYHMKQYIPGKPNLYGLKLWALADSQTGYLIDCVSWWWRETKGGADN